MLDGRFDTLMRYQLQNLDMPLIFKMSGHITDRDMVEDIVVDASMPYWLRNSRSVDGLIKVIEKLTDFIGSEIPMFIPNKYPTLFEILSTEDIQRIFDIITKKAALVTPLKIPLTFNAKQKSSLKITANIRNGICRESPAVTSARIAELHVFGAVYLFRFKDIDQNIDLLRKFAENIKIFLVSDNSHDIIRCNKFRDVFVISNTDYKHKQLIARYLNITVPVKDTYRNIMALAKSYYGTYRDHFRDATTIIIAANNEVEYKALRSAFPDLKFERIRISRNPSYAKMKAIDENTLTVYSPTSLCGEAVFMPDGYHLRKYRDRYYRNVPGVFVFDIRTP